MMRIVNKNILKYYEWKMSMIVKGEQLERWREISLIYTPGNEGWTICALVYKQSQPCVQLKHLELSQ